MSAPNGHLVFLDIETGPCSADDWAAFLESRGARDGDTPEHLAALHARTSLTGLARIASIGVAHGVECDPLVWTTEILSEIEMIDALRGWLGQSVGTARTTFVGWNVRGFDIPLLAQRALCMDRVRLARALTGGLNSKPWDRPVLDLMDCWPSPSEERFGKNGAAVGHRRQAEVCRRLGLPVQTGAMGADMARCIAEGDWRAVRCHLADDVRDLQRIYEVIGGAL